MNKKEKILVTGSAGFIGMNLCRVLLNSGHKVYGIDNLNSYYEPKLKKDRLGQIKNDSNFTFKKVDIAKYEDVLDIFRNFKPDKVVNLAAQAGVRYSLKNPNAYIHSNITGFLNILECCRYNNVKGLIYASSSSVYGNNKKLPFSINDKVDSPISIYAATKKANELMAHSYSHLYKLNTTGLRLFTVYGPWGRPDMAMYIFTEKIKNNKPILVFNNGDMGRDFTYIDDIIDGIISAIENNYSCEVFNLGNNNVENLLNVIKIIEMKLNKKAVINYTKIQPGDVKETFADIEYSKKKLNYIPKISLKEGLPRFIDWYKKYTL